jgi:hypothetical protein
MKLFLFVNAALVGGGLTAHALEGLPKRKPGLWEICSEMQGRPIPTGPIQTCVDEKTDDLMQQQADQLKHRCKPVDWKKDGDKIMIESDCKIMENTNTKATAIFTGDLNSTYRGDFHMTYDPPIHGRSEMNMTL